VLSSSECVTRSRPQSLSSSCMYELNGHRCLTVWIRQSLSKWCVHTEHGKTVLICLQAVTRFAQLADDSEEVPPLRNKKYSWWRLSKLEWDGLKLLHKVLKVSHRVCILHADTESLTIDNRSRRRHSNLSPNLRTLSPGERSQSLNSCNRHGLTQPACQSLLSSRMRFTAVWRT